MTYCVGLTGNIASGKSTVALLFNQLGAEIINADTISKQLTLKDTEAYNDIVARYGSLVMNEDGQLNRKTLRTIIFSNVKERKWLEQLLHPRIRKEIERQVTSSTAPYCIVEIPLLYDKSQFPYLHRVLLVTSPRALQIQRIIERDHCTEQHALSIIATQPSQEQRLNLADDVLINDMGLDHLKQEVEMLHEKYQILYKNL
jgi:dephospho-CoA kinase